MRIIISPAKKMNIDTDSPTETLSPGFLAETKTLCRTLRGMDRGSLQKLWKCNETLAALNIQRLQDMDFREPLTPAIFSYEGIQYRYLAPHVLERGQLDYLQRHLRMLSGFYGLLRPFDGVTPYRLEMGARLAVEGYKNLYEFWGKKLANQLEQEGKWVLNLASREYSKAIEPHLSQHIPFITCVFGELQGESVIEKGTMCKMARGQMVRWLAEEGITNCEAVKDFCQLGYAFSPQRSSEGRLVFLKGKDTTPTMV